MKRPKTKKWPAVLIGLVGCAAAAFLVAQEEEEHLPGIHNPPLSVETMRVKQTDYQIRVPAWGLVEPCETIDIRSEISGKVTTVPSAVFTGAELSQDTLLCSVDKRDYINALMEAIATHEQARQALEIEKGQQIIAQTEWNLLENSKWQEHPSKSLALRKPQLKERKAAVQIAAARQAQAALGVERARITSPCSGVILEENLAKGQVLDAGDVIMRIACTDRYHILAAYSPEHSVDPGTNQVSIDIGPNRYIGFVKSILPQIHKETRQRQVLVAFEGNRVTLGAYASIILPGPSFSHVAVLPIEALRPENTVWVLTENRTLEIRPVSVVAQDRLNIVITDGLAEGDEVILSHISSPLQEMELQTKAPMVKGPQSVAGKEKEGE